MFSLSNELLSQIAQTHGTPLYVYDLDHIRNRVSDLRIALGGHFKISYAMKANPNRGLIERMRDIVDCIDVSSGGEVAARSMRAGNLTNLASPARPSATRSFSWPSIGRSLMSLSNRSRKRAG